MHFYILLGTKETKKALYHYNNSDKGPGSMVYSASIPSEEGLSGSLQNHDHVKSLPLLDPISSDGMFAETQL